jgi:hypothetical protein
MRKIVDWGGEVFPLFERWEAMIGGVRKNSHWG